MRAPPLQPMNLKTPKVEGRKNERPLEPINLKSTKVEGHDYASPVPQASPPFGDDFEQCFKAGRKENEQRNDPARFSENPFRNYIGCPPLEPMNLKSPKVERRKKERPLQPMNLKSPKVEGRKNERPLQSRFAPDPRLSPPLSSRIRKNEQNETSFLRETEAGPPA